MFYKSTNPKIPHFNAQVFLENKTPIGKIDEVLGPLNQVRMTTLSKLRIPEPLHTKLTLLFPSGLLHRQAPNRYRRYFLQARRQGLRRL